MMSVGAQSYHNKQLILALHWFQTFGIRKNVDISCDNNIMHKLPWHAGRILIYLHTFIRRLRL